MLPPYARRVKLMADDNDHEENLLKKPLQEVLALVRESGPLEVQLDGDVFTISRSDEALPKGARDFLSKGGPDA